MTPLLEDYKAYYARLAEWSVHDAAILTLNRNPQVYRPAWFSYDRNKRQNQSFCTQYSKIFQIIKTHNVIFIYDTGGNVYGTIVAPLALVELAETVQLGFPEDLKEMVYRYHKVPNFKQLYEESRAQLTNKDQKIEELSQECKKYKQDKASLQKSLNTADKMFAGVVKEKFPNNHSLISNVHTCLGLQGIHVDDETIRGHYKRGTEKIKAICE